MKAIRLLIFFIIALLLTTAALSFLMATSQKVERSIVINTPASDIYNELIKLENFHKFSVWSQQDSSAVYTFSGIDGTVGATTSWKGSPLISGEGKIEITALEPDRKIVHDLSFTQPKKGTAKSKFKLSQTEKSSTTVEWIFELSTPRPWNIFNLMYSLDEKMGADFENGLKSLKTIIELKDSTIISPPQLE